MAYSPLDIYPGYKAAQAGYADAKNTARNAATQRVIGKELNRDRTFAETAYDLGAAGLQGAVTVGAAGYGLVNLATGGYLEDAVGLADNFQRTNQIIQGSKSTQLQYQAMQNQQVMERDGVLSGVVDFATNPALLLDFVVQNATSVLPAGAAAKFAAGRVLADGVAKGIGAAAINTAAVKAGTRAAVITGGAQMGGNAYVNVYNQAISEGLSPEEGNKRALAAGAATGVVGMAISKLPYVGAANVEASIAARLAGVPGVASSTGTFAKQVGRAFGKEATEEALQSGAERMIQNTASERKKLMDGVAMNAALGAVGGGLLGAAMGSIPAVSDFRNNIRQVIDETSKEAGVEDLAKSELEKRGETVMQDEAKAAAATQRAAEAKAKALVGAGFVANEDGTFSRPNDPFLGDAKLSADEALRVAADQEVVPEDVSPQRVMEGLPPEFVANEDGSYSIPGDPLYDGAKLTYTEALQLASDRYNGSEPLPMPDVQESPDFGSLPLPTVEESSLPLPTVEEEARGYRAYTKAAKALEAAGARYRVVDGKPVFEVTQGTAGNATTVQLDKASALGIVKDLQLLTPNEVAEAARYMDLLASRQGKQAPRVGPKVTQENALTAEEVQAKQARQEQEQVLNREGFYTDDGQTYWTLDEDGQPQQLSRDEALAKSSYRAENQDLLGDALATPVTFEQSAPIVGEVADPNQYQLRGIDPLWESVDEANRKEAAVQKMVEFSGGNQPTLPGMTLAQRWRSTFTQAIELHDQLAANPLKLNAAMRNSKMLQDFFAGAAAANIEPNTGAAVDYVADYARSVEASDQKTAKAIAAFADMVGATKPGTAPLTRWRTKLARSKIAYPGNMKGPAYAKFRDAVSKATITPGSIHFDGFMENFSASLTEQEAATPFGKQVREAYPYAPPAVKAASATQAKAKQITKGNKAATKPAVADDVADAMKTAEEAVLTEPMPEPQTQEAAAAEPAIQKKKRATRKALNKAAEETDAVVEEVEATAAEVRRAIDLEEADTTDADVARADAELARNEQTAKRQAPKLPLAHALELGKITEDATRRIQALAAQFAASVQDLKAQYSAPGRTMTKGSAEQEALADTIKKRMDVVDQALLKDAGDITTWAAMTGLIVQDGLVQGKASNNTKFSGLIRPAVKRFMTIAGRAKSPDTLRVYRDVLKATGLEQFIDQHMDGPMQAKAQEGMAELNRQMDLAIERMTSDPANAANVRQFRVNDGMYSMGPSEKLAAAIPRAELDQIVEDYNQGRPENSTEFVVFDTVEEAQNALGFAVPSAANGIYYRRGAYLIAENIGDAATAREVILHERTHAGLEGLLGTDRLPAVMNRMWANAQLRQRIQAKMKRQGLNRVKAAEEVLVDMSVAGEKLNKDLFSKIRAGITRTFETLFGVRGYVVPDRMVNELLHDTADYLRGTKTELNMGETYAVGLDAYAAVFEGKTVPQGPMFSVAAAEMNKFATGDASEVGRLQSAYQQYIKGNMAQNWKATGRSAASTSWRGVSRVAMDFLPLSQIADLNRGLFWTQEGQIDYLKAMSQDKLAKENENNKVLQGKRDTFYSSPEGEFRFSESGVELARDWQALVNSSKQRGQVDALNTVNQVGTMYKVFPDRSWDEQVTIDYTKENFTEADRRRAYEEVRNAWNSLSSDAKGGKDIYRRAQAMYQSLWAERMHELKRQYARIADASTDMADLDNPVQRISASEAKKKLEKRITTVIGRIKQGPYSPLQRFGDYYVVVRDPQGNVTFSSGHDSAAAAAGMEQSMRSTLKPGYTVATAKRTDFVSQMDGMSQVQYNRMEAALKGAFPEETESDRYARKNALATLQEVFLQSMPDNSLLTHANARRGIAGATMDSFRAYNDYVVKSAQNLASMRYDHKIQSALGEMRKMASSTDRSELNIKRAEVYDAVQRQHFGSQKFVQNPLSTAITSAGFLFYLTSPSQLFLNSSQTALVTMPVLASRYGIGSTLKYMKEATAEFARSKGSGMHSENGKLKPGSAMIQVMQALNSDGTLDFTQSYDLSDAAQRESSLTRSKWQQATHAAAGFMRLSEVYNREVAAYITVRGEMRKANITEENFASMPKDKQQATLAKLAASAREAAQETQFIYNQSNKALRMQDNFGRVVFQFQQFRANMLALMYRNLRDSIKGVNDPSMTPEEQKQARALAIKTTAAMMVTQLLLTGAAASVFAPLAFAFSDLFRDDDELLNSEEAFMQAAPQWLSMGLLGQVLDPSRFGFSSLVPVLGASRYLPASDDPNKVVDAYLLSALGPAYGLGSQLLRGLNKLQGGDFQGAANDMLPKPFADAYKVMFSEGRDVKDQQGIPWYERSNWDMMANFAGLKTGDQAMAQADRSAIYSGTARASDRRAELVGRYTMAETADERAEALADVAAWNQKWGFDTALALTASSLQKATKTRQEKILNAARYGVPSTRTPDAVRRLVDEN